jgi:hypothetical protein
MFDSSKLDFSLKIKFCILLLIVEYTIKVRFESIRIQRNQTQNLNEDLLQFYSTKFSINSKMISQFHIKVQQIEKEKKKKMKFHKELNLNQIINSNIISNQKLVHAQ